MKHLNICGEFTADYPKDAENRVKEIIAKEIGFKLLKNNLIEFESSNDNPYNESLRGEVVVIKKSDYEKMMCYMYNLDHYRFYNMEKDEEIILKDLL